MNFDNENVIKMRVEEYFVVPRIKTLRGKIRTFIIYRNRNY